MKTFREYLQNKRQVVLEATQAVGSANLDFFVKNILENLQKPDVSVRSIKGWIYWLLTHTSRVSDDMIPAGYSEKYMVNLPQIRINTSETTVKESGGFVHFTTKTNGPSRQRIGAQNEAKVTLKQYFSLNTDPSKLKETLNYTFRTIPVLAAELYKIAAKNNDQINFKFPDQLFAFMEHSDTLVVHYYNPASGSEIQQTVDRLFPDQVDRGLRVKSGFDIKHPGLHDPNIEGGGSHSEIIAWAVAGTIMREKDRILSKYDENSFGQKLLEVLKNYGSMDQRTLYAEYLKAQQMIPAPPKPKNPARPAQSVMSDLVDKFKKGQINQAQIKKEIDALVAENPGMERKAFTHWINANIGQNVAA
jgi:hypothetical protein